MENKIKSVEISCVPWNMKFAPESENRYRQYFFDTNIGFMRLSFAAMAIAATAFNIFAYNFFYNHIKNALLQMSMSFSLVALPLAALAISYRPAFRRHYHSSISLIFQMSLAAVITIINELPDVNRYSSYGSILFVLLINYGLFRQKFTSGILNGIFGSIMFLTYAKSTQIYPDMILLQITSYFCLFNFGGGAVSYILERSQRSAFLAKEKIEAEHERAENLLLNILPLPIASRLKDNQDHIADHIDEVTVLFADIVGFSERTRNTSPQELVGLLDSVFSEFDVIMERHGIEKIKTIGDNYMAASGLLDNSESHCERLATAAIDIMKYVKTHPSGVTLRVGIHTGPVIAGVIGRKKMIYDLWGDTVNIASRMESHGESGSIQVSEAVYHRLKSQFDLSGLRTITVKGQGPMRVASLNGKIQMKKAG